MPWTAKQQQVIDERNKTILVSAAAGSGKTATLVERIFRKITDAEHPADISSFLVVTFTKAAAAQLREKLMQKLEEAQREYPESEHIARQNILIQSADITTIDSFCLNIVKEYFSFLNLDPSVNIGDPSMMDMLKQDVFRQLFEQKYQEMYESEKETEFSYLLDLFCDGKKDDNLKALIDRIYKQMSSFPDPKRFLEQARECLLIEEEEDLNHATWMKAMFEYLHKKANAALRLNDMCLRICDEEEGPDHYRPQIESDREKLCAILHACDYVSMKQALELKWNPLSRKKTSKDPELVETCKNIRKEYKDEFDLKKIDSFKQPLQEILEDMKQLKTYLLPLLALTEEFVNLFMQEKMKRKMLEFSDISHMAYKLVCAGYDENGCAYPTEIGKAIAKRYDEIYIDEYQDSNYLQEDILTAVSGLHRGIYNMFMVGDVKQSIYRFRMARPEIFVNKYNRFTEDGPEIKIELNHNFRSKEGVLYAINFFFYQLMGKDLGKITYDENQALVPGKKFPEFPKQAKEQPDVEILIADSDNSGNLTDKMLMQYGNPDKDYLEGYMIANKIRSLFDNEAPMMVYDEKKEKYRPVQYRDIVILARSLKDYGNALYQALSSQGIPVYLEKSTGYFQAVEIQVILSMLSVIDNSRQDIPLSAVLLSPIGQLDESELAFVCASVRGQVSENLCLYEICEYYVEEWEDTDIAKKIKSLLNLIEELKETKQHVSVSELIWELLQKTGYYEYVSAMPAGKIRRSNVDMLLEKAVQFENGYYKGLFHFLQYVDKLKLMEKDEGEASVVSEDADVVRIMTIHKSKGLEYPIVFVAGLGKQFNKMELKDNVLVHPDYYLAAMSMNRAGRYKHNTAIRSIYGCLEEEEMMAENLRVLYVAMTRAKEKLILTAGVRDFSAMKDKYAYVQEVDDAMLPYNIRKGVDSYIKHILACMQRYDILGKQYHADGRIQMVVYNKEQILTDIHPEEMKARLAIEEIAQMAQTVPEYDFYTRNRDSFSYCYPHKKMTELAGKLSISDIKKMKAYDGKGYDISTEFANAILDNGKEKSHSGKSQNASFSGAERGTIIHKFMELFPFTSFKNACNQAEFIRERKQELLQTGIFDKQEISVISETKIMNFLQSELGCRMIEAACRGELFKERQFSASVPVSLVYDVCEDDIVVVQGIIDAYFYEGSYAVVMDYKTDVADEKTLIGRYKAQLASYAEVLERLTGKKVKEQIIYSFHLDKMIIL